MARKRERHIVAHMEFVWTVSRGRDTYGYNICSLYIDGVKVSSCNGGGYDMEGTALADWMESKYRLELTKLNSDDYYGLCFWNDKRKKRQKRWSKHCSVSLDGACGMSSMQEVLKRFGYMMEYVNSRSKNRTIYNLRER
jgi:hypothetical protein